MIPNSPTLINYLIALVIIPCIFILGIVEAFMYNPDFAVPSWAIGGGFCVEWILKFAADDGFPIWVRALSVTLFSLLLFFTIIFLVGFYKKRKLKWLDK